MWNILRPWNIALLVIICSFIIVMKFLNRKINSILGEDDE